MSISDLTKRCNDLIAALEFVKANETLFPEGVTVYYNDLDAWYYGDSAKAEIANALGIIRKHYDGATVAKSYDSGTFDATIEIPGTWLRFVLHTARTNVCRKVETGETVTREVPDYSQTPKKTVTEEVIRWECDPILGD